jgi:hypothetical protein
MLVLLGMRIVLVRVVVREARARLLLMMLVLNMASKRRSLVTIHLRLLLIVPYLHI